MGKGGKVLNTEINAASLAPWLGRKPGRMSSGRALSDQFDRLQELGVAREGWACDDRSESQRLSWRFNTIPSRFALRPLPSPFGAPVVTKSLIGKNKAKKDRNPDGDECQS
jgi:hypothetical protein